jgi:hypothetical protein
LRVAPERPSVDFDLIGDLQSSLHDIESISAIIEPLESGRDVLLAVDFRYDQFKAEIASESVDLAQLQHLCRVVGIGQDRQSAERRNYRAQELHSLASQIPGLV